jgi:SAM-dependent MidA family methyltransferase
MVLPLPNSVARARSDQLTDLIRAEIAKSGGFISFARFMELALYKPILGYYSASAPKFGQGGDFITAPHISPLFAQCLARQFQLVLAQMENDDILEIGAGSGLFAKDVLLELEKLNSLPKHYFILEISPELRLHQEELLRSECPHLLSRVQWLDALPKEFKGVIFANEVLDALPVHCFQIKKNQLYERSVGWENEAFCWKLTAPSAALREHVEKLQREISFPEEYASEINIVLTSFIQSLANSLKQGVIFLFDYGYGQREYYHPDRQQGTLMCYFQHQKHDNPLVFAGLQDMTAHVDFTAVAENAVEAGLDLMGYTTQQGFLLSAGLLENASKESAVEQYNQSVAIKKLMLPSEMGEAVKVMGLGKGIEMFLEVFRLQDRRRDL